VDVQVTDLVFLLRDPAQLVPELKLIPLNKQLNQLHVASDVLRAVSVTFPPHDLSDAASNPAEIVEFLSTENFREQVLREGL
jgi:hypothetical protein